MFVPRLVRLRYQVNCPIMGHMTPYPQGALLITEVTRLESMTLLFPWCLRMLAGNNPREHLISELRQQNSGTFPLDWA
jgi:hypothetical protein